VRLVTRFESDVEADNDFDVDRGGFSFTIRFRLGFVLVGRHDWALERVVGAIENCAVILIVDGNMLGRKKMLNFDQDQVSAVRSGYEFKTFVKVTSCATSA